MTDRTHIIATGGDDPTHETARAAIVGGDHLFATRSVGILVAPYPHAMRYWPSQSVIVTDDPTTGAAPEVPEGMDSTLNISEKEALALYHALADHFGHSVHDVRALRRDMDAQGKRLDKTTDALIAIATRDPAPVPAPVVNVAPPAS